MPALCVYGKETRDGKGFSMLMLLSQSFSVLDVVDVVVACKKAFCSSVRDGERQIRGESLSHLPFFSYTLINGKDEGRKKSKKEGGRENEGRKKGKEGCFRLPALVSSAAASPIVAASVFLLLTH